MDINVAAEILGETHDRIVVGMVASHAGFPAGILDRDAGSVPDPFLHFLARPVRKVGIDRRPSGQLVLVPLHNFQNFGFVGCGIKWMIQGPADLLGNGPLDAHALHVKVIAFVLLDGTGRIEAVKVIIPKPIGHQFVARRQSVAVSVDQKFA